VLIQSQSLPSPLEEEGAEHDEENQEVEGGEETYQNEKDPLPK